LILSFGTLPAAQAWLEETCSPFELLLDPERKVYQAYELERSAFRSWNPRTVWRYVQLLLPVEAGAAFRATRPNWAPTASSTIAMSYA
jgi:hypothetical protein